MPLQKTVMQGSQFGDIMSDPYSARISGFLNKNARESETRELPIKLGEGAPPICASVSPENCLTSYDPAGYAGYIGDGFPADYCRGWCTSYFAKKLPGACWRLLRSSTADTGTAHFILDSKDRRKKLFVKLDILTHAYFASLGTYSRPTEYRTSVSGLWPNGQQPVAQSIGLEARARPSDLDFITLHETAPVRDGSQTVEDELHRLISVFCQEDGLHAMYINFEFPTHAMRSTLCNNDNFPWYIGPLSVPLKCIRKASHYLLGAVIDFSGRAPQVTYGGPPILIVRKPANPHPGNPFLSQRLGPHVFGSVFGDPTPVIYVPHTPAYVDSMYPGRLMFTGQDDAEIERQEDRYHGNRDRERG